VRRTVEDFFADKPAGGAELAREFIREVQKLGSVTLHPWRLASRWWWMCGSRRSIASARIRFAPLCLLSPD